MVLYGDSRILSMYMMRCWVLCTDWVLVLYCALWGSWMWFCLMVYGMLIGVEWDCVGWDLFCSMGGSVCIVWWCICEIVCMV